ncbi:ATP-binding protein, partial [Candidatus Poseidoniaceae archaeon]|nr:ATP-binding protein [Candidatus Poseidoniaceae archaeon]
DSDYGPEFTGPAAKYKGGKTYKALFGKNSNDFKEGVEKGRGYSGSGKNKIVMTTAEINEMHVSMGTQFWQRVHDDIKDNRDNARIWGYYFSLVANVAEHPHRQWAEFIGWSMNPKGYNGKVYEWEHAMQATNSYLYLLHTILGEYDFKTAFELIKQNYKLIALDNYDDKVKLGSKGAKRTVSMGEGWTVMDNWFERYFDEVVAAIENGIDPNGIMTVNGKTLAEVLNINAEGKPRFTKPGIKAKINNSKAINNSRAININTESVSMSAWDFDGVLATTKSGVRATIPNPDGTPQPNRKVIFLAGGAGSGKGSVISKLGLEKQGFKIVNSDISLEWLKKNSGLPENMNDFTKEQRSTLGSLQHQARGISKRKMMKYQGKADGVVVDGTGGSINAMGNLVNEFKDKGYDVSMVFVETSLETALERNKNRKERSLLDKIVIKNHEAVQGNKGGFKDMFSDRFMEVKTDNLTQEDAMPASLTTKMNNFVSGYKKVRLDAEQFATEGADILAQGGEFDFSEFNVVTEGAQGPMFNTAMKRAKKFGTKDTYVLTARPPAAAVPIQQFLASQGLNIPIENISGLGNSTGEAKAQWMLEKFSEGYNNMFFADDVMQNVEAVKNVLDQLDIKSKVVQAKIKFSKDMKSTMDNILDGPQLTNIKNQSSINDVKNVDRLSSSGVYSNIKFSKKHRGEYESLISKNRPDLVKEGLVSKTVDNMFDLVDGLNVPASKKRKYEKIMSKWLATSVMKLPEDNYKLQQSVELAEKNNLDLFAYNNPNEIIEAYAGKSKEKPTNPDTVELFVKDESKTNDQYGITEYVVTEDKQNNEFWIDDGQQAVRKIVDTHWGPKSNPWCVIARDKDGTGTMHDAMENWDTYSDGPKRIVFENGKLIAMYANGQYWDRMDNDTDAPVIIKKKGNVTEKVELVPVGKGKVEEFVMEKRTVSSDKNTVTTEYIAETKDYEAGAIVVENRVNGQTVKETTSRPSFDRQGNDVMIVERTANYDKKGKVIESREFMEDGRTESINNTTALSPKEHGDLISHEITDGKIEYWFGVVHLESQGLKSVNGTTTTEIGFKTPTGFEVMDVTKRVDGKLRVDFGKILEVDPDAKGIPSERGYTPVSYMFSKKVDIDLNQILEESMNVDAKKRFSATQAKLKGGKFKVRGVIPPSAQDFMGLLYNFVGKGKQGDQHLEILKKALVDPFARGIDQLNTARQNSSEDYRALLKQFPDVKAELNSKLKEYDVQDHIGDFTVDQAVRVYLWNKSGFDVPGLSARDLKALDSFVKNDPDALAFADGLGIISKKTEGYTKPGEYWLVENIASDL